MRAVCVWLCVFLMGSLMAAANRTMGFDLACMDSSLANCSNSQRQYPFSSFLQDLNATMHEVRRAITDLKSMRPRHCQDLLAAGDIGRGVRQVYPYPDRTQWPVSVYCDHTVDGGGWTVFQHRTNTTNREDFLRTWVEYQRGFGRLEGEFWLGLDTLHALTSTSLQELRIDLADYDGVKRWAKYGMFSVGPAQDHYRLSVGRYEGNAGDALTVHKGMKFSTPDADHDTYDGNCAAKYRGAWWYYGCHDSNLNGYQYHGQHASFADGINWVHFRGDYYSLMNTTLMIRPAF